MNLLALVLGLGIERLLTHLFHLRAFHWLDPVFDRFFSALRISQPNLAIFSAVLLVAVVVAPVALFDFALADRFAKVPHFVFSVFVLLICLGPRDLMETVQDYCATLGSDASLDPDLPSEQQVCGELLEREVAEDESPDVEAAIFAQANNRIFGVVFWFVLLGPTGAWMFRVLDLLQRRAVEFASGQDSVVEDSNVDTAVHATTAVPAGAILLHRVLAWIPSRLLGIGYGLAGSYDGAIAAWRTWQPRQTAYFPGPTDQWLGAIGQGANATDEVSRETCVQRAESAMSLISRTLWVVWCPLLALMTLYDFLN